MLMDLFFESTPLPLKRRVHFHSFLLDVHARMHRWRQRHTGDPVPTIGRDIVWRLRGEESDTCSAKYTRAGLWITALWSVVLALAQQSVIGLWHDLGSIVTPMLLLPVGTALLGRAMLSPRWTAAALLAPLATTIVWLAVGKWFGNGDYPLSMRPIYAGLVTSLAIYVPGWLFTKKQTPAMSAGA